MSRERFEKLDKLRKQAKVVNYSSLYGVGAAKLAREMGVTKVEAQSLLEAFWKMNWAIRVVAKSQFTKVVNGKTWVKNPVSGFYYELRYEKDTWSTINQSTGVYIFDSWLARARQLGYMGKFQFHDETGSSVPDESHTRDILQQAIDKLNKELTFNVPVKIDIQTGQNYAEVH